MKIKNKSVKILILTLGTVAFLGVALLALLKLTYASVTDMPPLRNGDIVFHTSPSQQSKAVMMASVSKYSHMGMIKKKLDGSYVVVEAVGPVIETPLQEWVDTGVAGRITVKRMEGLTDDQAKKILANARKYYGRPYDLYFYFDNNEIYCSELVYLAYKAAGIELGTIEKIKDLKINNPASRQLIKDRGKSHPVCKDAGEDECMERIMEQELVTPESIAKDKSLTTIYTNY